MLRNQSALFQLDDLAPAERIGRAAAVLPEDILSKLLERQNFDEIFHTGYDDDNNNKLYESWTSHIFSFGDVVLFVDVCD